MASENGKKGAKAGAKDEDHGPRECMPCRGSGQVISKLGGEETTRPCPWCGGSGERTASADAQAAWRERRAAESETPGAERGTEPAAAPEPPDAAA
ncbi:MAG TPA: hypothetical protein VMG62_02970 [Solirubrobacteraceae bacterium]|nr:hypothetical protein [Solirubrobacteraceae bacterium]